MTSPKRSQITPERQQLLKKLPGVDAVLDSIQKKGLFPEHRDADVPRTVLTAAVRDVVSRLRGEILSEPGLSSEAALAEEALLEEVRKAVDAAMSLNLDRLVNATGVVVHTNLGRSLLSCEAAAQVQAAASRYTNLEFDLAAGRRGSRYTAVEGLICEISGAESAMVVNNNAAAVLLSLDTAARGREVVVSRGELVEIGGSFRIPDVMAKSGAVLKEVGTTNRTHRFDYENAVSDRTGLLLKVHTSNFGIVGFTRSVSLEELVAVGKEHGLPVMEDLGSGTFVDFSRYGLLKEPTVQESVAAGADIVTFSGDKLLGGPQAGVIAGKRSFIEKIKKNPLNRALRIDKLTLAALEGTLRAYRDETSALERIPTLRMLTCPLDEISRKAEDMKSMLEAAAEGSLRAELVDAPSRVGGGALPLLELPSKCVALRIPQMSAKALETRLRSSRPPIIVRIEEDRILMDMRTVLPDEMDCIREAVLRIVREARA
jgi:L-seryl-tRNA(Ser) seleniumtransferase